MVWQATMRSFRVSRSCSSLHGRCSGHLHQSSGRHFSNLELVSDRRSESLAPASSQASILVLLGRLITCSLLSPLDLSSGAERLPHSRAFIEHRPTTRHQSSFPGYTQARHTPKLSEPTRPYRACPVAWEMQTELTLGQEVARSGRHAGLF